MDVAHLRNDHDPFCGTDLFPCEECEALHDELMRLPEMDLWRELGQAEGFDVPDPERRPHDYGRAGDLAHTYLKLIRPGRLGDLYHKPYWITELADIGDDIWLAAEAEVHDELKKKYK
jgi:hypothetical protein